jgi:clan AA aspartic protease, TIGR02281 family
MFKKLFFASCAALALAGTPQYLKFGESLPEAPPEHAVSGGVAAVQLASAGKEPQANYVGGVRTATIPMDRSGHFVADFRLNGRPIRAVVDTGATFVAINESTARAIGVRLSGPDFAYEVNTANGRTKAARVTLDRVEIGQIRVAGVDAFVLRDTALGGTLVGMSFMSRLGSYSVEGTTLHLSE